MLQDYLIKQANELLAIQKRLKTSSPAPRDEAADHN